MLPVSLDCPLIFYLNCLCTARKTTIVEKGKSKTIETRLQIERKCSEVDPPPPPPKKKPICFIIIISYFVFKHRS